MSEYSAEDVREAVSVLRIHNERREGIERTNGARALTILTAYADLLEQIERAKTGASDAEIMAEWFKADGSVHGPNVETVTMPQAKYLAFRRSLQSVAHLLPSGERGGVEGIGEVAKECVRDLRKHAKQCYNLPKLADDLRRLANRIERKIASATHPPAQAAQAGCPVCGKTTPHHHLRGTQPAEVGEYAAGWRQAARWAERDDLIADIGSPAYERDKAFVLQGTTAEPVAQGEAVSVIVRIVRGVMSDHSDYDLSNDEDAAGSFYACLRERLEEHATQPRAVPAQPAGRQAECRFPYCECSTSGFDRSCEVLGRVIGQGEDICTHPATPVGVPDGYPVWALMRGDDYINVNNRRPDESEDAGLKKFLHGAVRSLKQAKFQGYRVVPATVVLTAAPSQGES